MKHLVACRRSSTMLAALVLGLAAAAPTVFAQNSNPTVLPSSTVLFGRSYGDWSAEWARWAFSVPAATNPVLDTTGAHCGEGQSGQVWFLAGTFGGSAARTCTVPAGKYLFFPVLNTTYICFHPVDPDPNCADVRAFVAGQMDSPMLLQATIDGVPVANLINFRAASRELTVQLPRENVFTAFGIPVKQGAYRPSATNGYFLLLAPLSPVPHTIYFKGVSNSGFTVEVTYNLTVR